MLGNEVRLLCCYYFIALSCVPTSRSFDRMEQLCFYRAGLNHVYLRLFRKAVEKIKVFLKSDSNNGYFTSRTTLHFSSNGKYSENKF